MTTATIAYITTAFLLGLSGLIPGPLLTLVISETLKHGIKAGVKVAISPLFTDLPIIAVTIFIMSRLANTNYILGAISFGGSLFLVYLACESLSYRSVNPDSNKGQSLIKKSIIANFLNPSPYVFWFTIGAPAIIKAYNENLLSAALFIIVFYAVLVGSKVVIAAATEGSKHFLNSRYYLLLIRSLGICLLLFALYFIKNGVAYFSVTD